jgi:hypothetical protein
MTPFSLLLLLVIHFGGKPYSWAMTPNCGDSLRSLVQFSVEERSKGTILEGKFNVTRHYGLVNRAIPQIKQIAEGPPRTDGRRPVLIDLGGGNGNAANGFSEKMLNMVVITAETDTVTEGSPNLRMFKGSFFENMDSSEIRRAIAEMSESQLGHNKGATNLIDSENSLADGGYDLAGVFSYSVRPDLAYRKLSTLLKVGAPFYVVSTNGRIEPPGGYRQVRIPGMEGDTLGYYNERIVGSGPYNYPSGQVPARIDALNDSRVMTLDGKVVRIFDYLARLGGFKVEYWNQGIGEIHALETNSYNGLPRTALHTFGDVIILTKVGEPTNLTSSLELISVSGAAPPVHIYREVDPERQTSPTRKIELDRVLISEIASFDYANVAYDPANAEAKFNELRSRLLEERVHRFSPEATLRCHPLAYGNVFLSKLTYNVQGALDYFVKYKTLIMADSNFALAYDALNDLYSSRTESKNLLQLASRLNSAYLDGAVSLNSLKKSAVAAGNPYGISIESAILGRLGEPLYLYNEARMLPNAAKYESALELKHRGWQAEVGTISSQTKTTPYSVASPSVMYSVGNDASVLGKAWAELPLSKQWLNKAIHSTK